jgi:murein DD-endopeptidase MepM/ murein hydrolase activator NlpD
MFVARRRRRPWRLVLATVAFLPLAWLAMPGGPSLPGGDDTRMSTEVPQAQPVIDPAERREAEASARTPVFATFGPMELHLPALDPVVVGFHEASSDEALALAPVGEVESNDNTTKFEPPEEVEGVGYRVLSSRGRVHSATSAVDVVMREDEPVLAPVSGTVTQVEEYVLYGNHRDVRIELAPADAPDLRIVLIHVDEVEVEEGDRVEAGDTVLAGTARPFPFGSQIDRFTEPDRWPHVHLEVKVEDEDGEDEVEDDG